MYIHNFLLMVDQDEYETDQGYFSKLNKKVTGYVVKPFFYNIGGTNFTLDQIKHGMIRLNKKKPGSWSVVLNNEDPKRKILGNAMKDDPRINFVCLEFPELAEHTSAFSSGTQ
jgi:hypothetical protein